MAKLTPKKIDLEQINGGVEYTEQDGVQPSTINGVIGDSAYAQYLATNTPDTTNANSVGVPSVSIKEKSDGTPQLVFKNLKGDSGAINGNFSNSLGTSSTDGYSQVVINDMVSKPNLLINGDFRINQRGQSVYGDASNTTEPYPEAIFTVDRWKLSRNYDATFDTTTRTLSAGSKGEYSNLYQKVELNLTTLVGKMLTFSVDVETTGSYQLGFYKNTPSTSNTLKATFFTGTQRATISLDITDEFSSTDTIVCQINARKGSPIVINNAKLEVGTATPFVPRPYAEEFALCQRYYQVINIGATSTLPFASGETYYTVQKTSKMRIEGTTTDKGVFLELGATDRISPSTITNKTDYVSLRFYRSGLPTGTYSLSGEIHIDAEIY